MIGIFIFTAYLFLQFILITHAPSLCKGDYFALKIGTLKLWVIYTK